MSNMNFHQVASVPATPENDSFYFINDGVSDYAEAYLTDDAGVAKMIGNSTMINQLIAAALNATSMIELVADITARDALTLAANGLVLVTDASADPSVDAGAAMYFYDQATDTYIKVTEFESLDVTVNWGDIAGGPTSTPAAIDTAVAASHTHTNLATLDNLSEGADGCLKYNGNPVQSWATNNW